MSLSIRFSLGGFSMGILSGVNHRTYRKISLISWMLFFDRCYSDDHLFGGFFRMSSWKTHNFGGKIIQADRGSGCGRRRKVRSWSRWRVRTFSHRNQDITGRVKPQLPRLRCPPGVDIFLVGESHWRRINSSDSYKDWLSLSCHPSGHGWYSTLLVGCYLDPRYLWIIYGQSMFNDY